jgi:hypothetical protein
MSRNGELGSPGLSHKSHGLDSELNSSEHCSSESISAHDMYEMLDNQMDNKHKESIYISVPQEYLKGIKKDDEDYFNNDQISSKPKPII